MPPTGSGSLLQPKVGATCCTLTRGRQRHHFSVSFISVDLAAKLLGLLRELRSGAARIGVLADSPTQVWLRTRGAIHRTGTRSTQGVLAGIAGTPVKAF
jgi:hypothetical protein